MPLLMHVSLMRTILIITLMFVRDPLTRSIVTVLRGDRLIPIPVPVWIRMMVVMTLMGWLTTGEWIE